MHVVLKTKVDPSSMKTNTNPVKLALLAAAGLLPSSLMGGTIPAHPSDARFETNSSGSVVSSPSSGSIVFVGRDYYANNLSHMVVPFQLPDLGDGTFSDVSVTFRTIGPTSDPEEAAVPRNMNLWALPGSRSFSSPLTTDVNNGSQNHTALGYLVKQNFLDELTVTFDQVVSTDPAGPEATVLADWLNEAYQDGLNSDNFVFMRISPPGLEPSTVGDFDGAEYGYGYNLVSGSGWFGSSGPFLSYTFTPAAANKPVILNLSASPTSVSVGGSSVLSWSVTGADTLTLNPGEIDVTGLTSYTVNPSATTTYSLTASSTGGDRVRSTTVAIQSGVSVRSDVVTVQQAGNAGNTLAIPKPSGISEGDLMIAVITKNNSGSQTPKNTTAPAGWILIDQKTVLNSSTHRQHGSAFYKIVGAEDAGVTNYTFGLTTNTNLGTQNQNGVSATIVAFGGVDSSNPFDTSPGSFLMKAADSTNTTTANSITTNTPLAPVVMIAVSGGNNTNITNFTTATSPGALAPIALSRKQGSAAALAWGIKPEAGPTGDGSANLSTNSNTGALLLALKESPKPSIGLFSASPSAIKSGEAVTLTWSVAKTDSVTIDGLGTFGTSGSLTVTPSETTSYTIRASNADGESVGTATVTVLSPGPYRYYRVTPTAIREPVFNLLYMTEFQFTRDGVRVPAVSVTSTGNTTNAGILDNDATGYDTYFDNPGSGKPFRPITYDMGGDPANWVVNGNRIGSTYAGAGFDMVSWRIDGSHDGVNWSSVTQQVNYRTPVLASTLSANIPFDFAPSVAFSANPSNIELGGSSTLSWFVGGAQTVSIEGIGENLPFSGTQVVTPGQGSTTYTLTAANGDYGTTVATATVISGAVATPVDISNGSFEADINSDASGTFSAGALESLSGWTVVARSNSAFPDTQQVAVGSANLAAADGTQSLMLMAGAAVGQLTDLNWSDLNPGDQLKLTIAAGDRAYNPDGNPRWADESFIGFTNGMAGVASGDISNVIGRSSPIIEPPTGYKSGTMGDVTYTYTLNAEEFMLSGKVGIFIASLGYRDSSADGADAPGAQSFWDNVRVELVRAPGPRILSFTSDATSIIAGAEATLSWNVENADTVTITGLGTVAASGTATVSPSASGTYTLTATNAEATKTRDIDLYVTGPVVYRYFRFTAQEVRVPLYFNQNIGVAISEFEIYNGTTLLTGATASTPTSNVSSGREPANVLDGNFNTIWYDQYREPLVLDYGTGVLATSYRFATNGNDTRSDPVSWLLEGSLDGNTWFVIDQRTGESVTETRTAWHTTLNTNFNPDYPVIEGTPVVNSFTAGPASIGETESTTLSWDVSGADSVELVGFGTVDAVGSQVVSPRSSINYYILARNASGFTFESARVQVDRLPRGGIIAEYDDATYETDITDGSIVSGPNGDFFPIVDVGRFSGLDTLNHIVIPFKLPDLGPGGFLEAELSVNVIGGENGASGRIPVQLFAIPGARADSFTLDSDIVDGADNALSNGYLLKSGFLNATSPLDAEARSGETGAAANGLGYWLNEAYANGANAGQYVFIRLSPDALSIPEGSGFGISSADDLGNEPILSYVFNPDGVSGQSPIISNFATNTAILTNGNSTNLQWTVLGATSVEIDGVPVAGSGTLSVSPTTNTTYTLTATNANGTSTAKAVQVVIEPGSYRYLRFSVLKIREVANVNVMGDVALSLSEFQIIGQDGEPIPASTAGVVGSNDFGGGSVLVNGSLNDSWYGRVNGAFTIDYRNFVLPIAYRIGTTNGIDAIYDPVSWLLEGSLDGNTWTVVDERTNVAAVIPETKSTFSDTFYLTDVPEFVSFAPAARVIPAGTSTTLSWEVTGAESVSIDNGIGAVDAIGSIEVSPEDTTIYTITATGNGVTRSTWTRVDVDTGAGLLATVYDDLDTNPDGVTPRTSFYELINPISALDAEPVAATFIQKGNIDYNRLTTYDRKPTDWPGLTSHNSYAVRFDGWFNITIDGPGDYTFGTASDGGSTIFLDLNDDGDFDDAGELIVNNNLVDAIQSEGKRATVNLTGNRVRIAIGHWDNYGVNDKIQVRFKKGTQIGYSQLSPVNGTSGHFTTFEPVGPWVNASLSTTRVVRGQSATLSWNVAEAESVSVDNGIGAVDATGSVEVTPVETTTYTVSGTAGEVTNTRSVTLQVFAGGLNGATFDTRTGDNQINPISTLINAAPSASFLQTDDIAYADGTMAGSLPGLTDGEDFSVLWTAWLDVTKDGPGVYSFGLNSDDGSRIYIDFNNDGDFDDAGELVCSGNTGGATTGSANLTAYSYRIAIGYYEGGLNDLVYATFKKGSNVPFASQDPIGGSSGHFLPYEPTNVPASSITVGGESVSAASTIYGTAAAVGTFTVSGADIWDTITVTAPTGFEVSTSEESGYASSISVGGNGAVADTTVYVRLAGTAAVGSPSGDVSITSTGAESKTVAVEGTVSAKEITVTADAVGKTYGDADPALTYSVDGLVNGDALSGALERAAGEDVGTYSIAIGSLSNANYSVVSFTGADFTISVRPITITANALSKTYGDADPALTYSVNGLVGGDELTGALSRAEGENVGTYAISQGTLAAGSNYSIDSFTGADLTIDAKAVTVTLTRDGNAYTASADGVTDFTYSYSGRGETSYGPSADAPEEPGDYTVTATVADSNYTGSASEDYSVVIENHPAFNVTSITMVGTVCTLVWESVEGASYTIEATSNIADPQSWAPLVSDVASQGASTTTVIDLAKTSHAGATKVFMRVLTGTPNAN
jgi:hypothetical protein